MERQRSGSRIRNRAAFFVFVTLLALASARSTAAQTSERLIPRASASETVERAFEIFAQLPNPEETASKQANLGQRLFHEKSFSRNGASSCASCHDIENGGDDGKTVSIGPGGAPLRRNAPSVLNATLQSSLFWDGRAITPAERVTELARHAAATGVRLPNPNGQGPINRWYRDQFEQVYGRATEQTFVDAMLAFQRRLLTPGSRFDQFLVGEGGALDVNEMAGLERFISLGCSTCHQGPLLGGNLFQKSGIFSDAGPPIAETEIDYGRFEITDDPADRFVFKVPSLRNVALTAPYFHDGSADTLDTAIAVMGRRQLGIEISAETRRQIEVFLRTLTGTLRKEVAGSGANR